MSEGTGELFGYQEEEINQLNLTGLFLYLNLRELDEGSIIQKYGKCKKGKTFPVFFPGQPVSF